MKLGDEGDIQIDSKVPLQQARQVIKYLVDASVELVTNSDDSYRRMDISSGGSINLTLHRLRGGKWRYFKVSDDAEGMDLDQLESALIYGRSASGFDEGRPVRGLWGRGLKETILAIGSGTIETVKNGEYVKIEVWWDPMQRSAKWRFVEQRPADDPNSTSITVIPSQDCPIVVQTAPKFLDQVAKHYALRDIWDRRDGKLHVEDSPGRSGGLTAHQSPIRFHRPEGELVLHKTIETPVGYALLRVWESSSPLSYNSAEPFSMAGFVIKSESASLDNTLLGLEADELARHFWGEVVCDGLAEHIRQGDEGLLTTARQGLDWRHRSLRDLRSSLRTEVEPLIENLRKRSSQDTSFSIPDRLEKSLAKLLNQLAKDELLEGLAPDQYTQPSKIDDLVIRPTKGTAPPGEKRIFSLYFPVSLATSEETIVELEYESQSQIWLYSRSVSLTEHPNHPTLLYGKFEIMGQSEGDEAYIYAKVQADILREDVAEFVVGKFERSRTSDPEPSTGGLIREIRYDDAPDPQQRVQFSDGVIRIFHRFPGISQYLPVGVNTNEGKAILAELVLEAFCRQVARARLDRGHVVHVLGAEIDAFNAEVNRLMKKSLPLVHDLTLDPSI